jgi:drug/metabolite transporter (DMT)-like permease
MAASTATLWFGAFRSRTARARTWSPKTWTCVGAFAIPLWSTWPALALWSLEMPAFECLTIAFGVGWITLTLLDRPSRAPPIAHGGDPLHTIAHPQTAAAEVAIEPASHRRTPTSADDDAEPASHRANPTSADGTAEPASHRATPRSAEVTAEPALRGLPPPVSTRWLSWLPAIACAVGLSGSNAFHILATHYIPAAEANLISYLWPVEIVAAGAVLGLFTLRVRQIIGLGLGFAGAAILLAGGKLSLSGIGVGLALFSGLSWAAYCVFRLKWPFQPAHNVLGTGCALSTALCAVLHFSLEPTVAPSLGALGAAAAVGVVPLALGNFAWDEGFRRGDSQLLAVLAYATPLCSALLLGALGLASLSWDLLLGAVVIVTAGVLSRTDL